MATPPLPKRFQPLLQQAQTEAALRYGSQESGLVSLLGQLSRQHQNDLAAQQTANMSLLGSLKGADTQLQGFYNDAGLTPQVQSQLVGSPTGARLAGEMASARTANQGSLLGAQASNQYLTGKINSDFGDRLQQVSDQSQAEQKERGLYTSSLLDQLITGDRSARHDAGVAAQKQANDNLQSQLDRESSTTNAALGQGYGATVNKDGSISLSPIPGGKADPAAKTPKASKPTGADRSVQTEVRKAASWIKSLDAATAKTQADPAKRRQTVQEILLKGDQVSGIPSIGGVGLDVALDMYYDKALSGDTVTALHNAGVKVKFLGNGTTTAAQQEAARRKAIKKTSRTNANVAPDSNGQMRPT